MNLTFDIETNGLPWWVKGGREDLKVHCIVTQDADTEELLSFGPDPEVCDGPIEDGLKHLSEASRLIGHNIGGFDIPVLEMLYPDWTWPYEIYDTRFVSRLTHLTTLMTRTAKFRNANGRSEKQREEVYPRRLMSPFALHKLEAWGYRLKYHKGSHLADVGGVQEEFSRDLLFYCQRDVKLTTLLYHHLREQGAMPGWPPPSEKACVTESLFGYLLCLQERNGVGFNREAAGELEAQLRQRQQELLKELRAEVSPWYAPDGPRNGLVYPKRTMKSTTRKDGSLHGGWGAAPRDKAGRPLLAPDEPGSCARTKVKLVEFNPGSRQHIARVLRKRYGWQPQEYNEDGTPHLDDDVLASLDYPLVPQLREYLVVDKRLGQLADGKGAWLRHEKGGIIRGRVAATGARTTRCSHSQPNMAQVPRATSPYGRECRSLFRPTREGWVQVGVDASGLELRMLAHYLHRYDGGQYAELILAGDPHSDWQKSTGLFFRDAQKTWTYATLYGAGDYKRGLIVLEDWRQAFEQGLTDQKPPGLRYAEVLGERSRKGLLQDMPALDLLLKDCREAYKRGWLKAIDGSVIRVVSEHGALNDLLQSAGARVMKLAKVSFYLEQCVRGGYVHGKDFGFMLDVHDENQIECPENLSRHFGASMASSITWAGEWLGVRVPLAGEFKVGSNWSETH